MEGANTFAVVLNTGPCELGHVDVYPLSLRAGDVLPAPGERLVAVETLAAIFVDPELAIALAIADLAIARAFNFEFSRAKGEETITDRLGDTLPLVGSRVYDENLVLAAGLDTAISHHTLRKPGFHAVETLRTIVVDKKLFSTLTLS